MENQITAAAETLERIIKSASYWKRPDDAEQIEKITLAIGGIDRESYVGLRAEWRRRYKAISLESRQTKPQRKGGNTKAQFRCQTLRRDAREMMQVRHALKACARTHAARSNEQLAVA